MKMTRSFQTFLLPQTVLAVSKADQGLLEQPGFQFPKAGGKLIPVHTAAVAGSQQQGCPGY